MNVLKLAVLKWGSEKQLDMLQEECAELISAINKFKRGRITTKTLAQEIVDVKIMVQQMWEVFAPEELDEAYELKINRLERKINECSV